MAETSDINKSSQNHTETGWGKKLFLVTLVGIFGFFYWLLIYSGGTTVHH